MVLLDTTVVSELRKVRGGKADPRVAARIRTVPAGGLVLSAITVRELEIGVLLIERRDPAQGDILRRWPDGHVLPAFAGRILPVDAAVARASARLSVPDPLPYRDGLIAATALVHGMAVATRNVADFAGAGVRLIDPWDGSPAP